VKISTSLQGDNVMLLQVEGEVDAHTAQEFAKTLKDLFGQGHRRMVVDVSGMTFISSAGIRVLFDAYRQAVQLDGQMRLAGPTDQVRRVFEIAGLYELLQITDGLEEALNNW
jgi:anti-anti-sigma factor